MGATRPIFRSIGDAAPAFGHRLATVGPGSLTMAVRGDCLNRRFVTTLSLHTLIAVLSSEQLADALATVAAERGGRGHGRGEAGYAEERGGDDAGWREDGEMGWRRALLT